MNTWWTVDGGFVGYTEDRELVKRIKRHYKEWHVMGEYYTNGKILAKQFKIPRSQGTIRTVKRLFGELPSD